MIMLVPFYFNGLMILKSLICHKVEIELQILLHPLRDPYSQQIKSILDYFPAHV
jgi:hypothetical protein